MNDDLLCPSSNHGDGQPPYYLYTIQPKPNAKSLKAFVFMPVSLFFLRQNRTEIGIIKTCSNSP